MSLQSDRREEAEGSRGGGGVEPLKRGAHWVEGVQWGVRGSERSEGLAMCNGGKGAVIWEGLNPSPWHRSCRPASLAGLLVL